MEMDRDKGQSTCLVLGRSFCSLSTIPFVEIVNIDESRGRIENDADS